MAAARKRGSFTGEAGSGTLLTHVVFCATMPRAIELGASRVRVRLFIPSASDTILLVVNC